MSSLVLVSSLQTRKLKSGPEHGFYKRDGRRYDYGFRILNSPVSVAGGRGSRSGYPKASVEELKFITMWVLSVATLIC